MSETEKGRDVLLKLLRAAEINPAAVLDAQLLGWSKSTHNKSPQITLQLADDDDIAPFELLTLAKGKVAGQILSLVVFVSDGTGGETYVAAPMAAKPAVADTKAPDAKENASGGDSEAPREGPLCKLAGMLCTNPQFWFWIGQNYEGRYATPEQAAKFVRDLCLIESRKELDTNEQAATIFHEDIRIPFAAWLKKNPPKAEKPTGAK